MGLPCGVEKQGYPPGLLVEDGPRELRPPAQCHTHLSHSANSGLPRPPCMRPGSDPQCAERRPLDERNVVAREFVKRQQLTDLHLHQLEQLLVVHLVIK